MADSKFSVAKLFVSVTLSETVTKDKLKEKIKEDAKFKNKIFLCSDGSIICGHDTNEPVEYGFNESAEARVEAIETILADFGVNTGNPTVKKYVDDAVKSAKTEVIEIIEGLDLAQVGGDGKYVKVVSQENGKVTAEAADLNAAAVAATAIEADENTVAVDGVTVKEQVSSLGKSIKDVQKSAATYTIKGVGSNDTKVRESFKLYQTVNGATIEIGDPINIYKDSSLKSVELVKEGKVKEEDGSFVTKTGQFLEFTYILEDGTESTVDLDVSTFLVESEFKNGLEVNTSGEVSIKVDDASETFLTVSETGVKVAGVQEAINTAVETETNRAKGVEEANAKNIADNKAAIDVLNGTEDGSVAKAVAKAKEDLIGDAAEDYNTLGKLEDKIQAAATVVTAKADGHVTVTVDTTAADGHAVVTVAEDDIASADALQEEIDRAKKIEGDLTEVITKMYDGQAKTAVEVKDINYNLVSIVQELENASNYWESYDDLSSSSTVNVEVDTDGDNLAPGNL